MFSQITAKRSLSGKHFLEKHAYFLSTDISKLDLPNDKQAGPAL